jgi:hypothetical protein
MSMERRSSKSIDMDADGLADLHTRQLRLFEIRDDIDLARHRREKTLARLHEISDLYGPVRDRAILRGEDFRVGQIEFRLREPCLLQCDAGIRLPDLAFQDTRLCFGSGKRSNVILKRRLFLAEVGYSLLLVLHCLRRVSQDHCSGQAVASKNQAAPDLVAFAAAMICVCCASCRCTLDLAARALWRLTSAVFTATSKSRGSISTRSSFARK